MNKEISTKVGEIMQAAAFKYKFNAGKTFADAVGESFWSSFGQYEQSPLMQYVYCVLCDMGYTPLERHQNY